MNEASQEFRADIIPYDDKRDIRIGRIGQRVFTDTSFMNTKHFNGETVVVSIGSTAHIYINIDGTWKSVSLT